LKIASKDYLLLPQTSKEDIMNKLVLALITVTTLGLSAAAFAQNPGSSMQQTVQRAQARAAAVDKQAPIVDQMPASHRTGVRKGVVAHHRTLHRGSLHAHHYRNGKSVITKHTSANKKIFVKHAPAGRTAKTKASS
jgi:Ni/Co efflux regulator RcnB